MAANNTRRQTASFTINAAFVVASALLLFAAPAVLASAVPPSPVEKTGSDALYVLGTASTCPENYLLVTDETDCKDSQSSLTGTPNWSPKPLSVDTVSEADYPGGCSVAYLTLDIPLSSSVTTSVIGLYFNTNLAGTQSDTTSPISVDTTYWKLVCRLIQFTSFSGDWELVGQGLQSAQLTDSVSWSTTTQQSTTKAFTYGLTTAVMAGITFGDASFGVSQSVTEEWSTSVTNSVRNMNGGVSSFACGAISCPEGNLYQWVIYGEQRSEYGGGAQTNKQCSFVCVPLDLGPVKPKCPNTYCANTQEGCQCCTSNVWATNTSNSVLPSICT